MILKGQGKLIPVCEFPFVVFEVKQKKKFLVQSKRTCVPSGTKQAPRGASARALMSPSACASASGRGNLPVAPFYTSGSRACTSILWSSSFWLVFCGSCEVCSSFSSRSKTALRGSSLQSRRTHRSHRATVATATGSSFFGFHRFCPFDLSLTYYTYVYTALGLLAFAFLDALQLCAVHLTSKGLPWANVVVSRCVGLRSRALVKRVPSWCGDVVPTGVNTVVARTIQFVNWPTGFKFAHQAYDSH